MAWLMVLGFAVSSSIDNLGVGISYGIRGIRIGLLSNLVMAVVCFICSEAGIRFGGWLSAVLPGVMPVAIGAFMLTIIGFRIILMAIPRTPPSGQAEGAKRRKAGNRLERMLQNPETADFDRSGEIGIGEAVVLGIALSANAITNGLGAGLLGLSPLAISLAAAAGSFITVWAGVAIGRRAANVRIGRFTLGQFGTLLSGVIIVLLACRTLL
ncbi:sporulation membrane protein YtaF [Cohnella lubricantis]|uniref:Sporulation membrane protein YtaF n=1 Tax=Cohnella lubricantis TaxID=2163172 RepID=A0A841T8G1_9BACL|nr:sporulation membrane protein YtaF [Cohnella lubricantis]MBB6676346.1 sporulation membrane protein YtaF [Cohnella lubricantis]MBP2120284.1 putative sporulation protein YtaF [Cohnella lubricantis]